MSRLAIDTNTRPLVGSEPKAAVCALANAVPKSASKPITSPVDFISGPSTVSTLLPSGGWNRLNGITASLTAIGESGGRLPPSPLAGSSPSARSVLIDSPSITRAAALASGVAGRLGDERHRARGARVGLEHVEHVGAERELDVEQPEHADPAGDRLGGLADPVDLPRRRA